MREKKKKVERLTPLYCEEWDCIGNDLKSSTAQRTADLVPKPLRLVLPRCAGVSNRRCWRNPSWQVGYTAGDSVVY